MGVTGFDSEADYSWHAEVVDTLLKPSATKELTKILLPAQSLRKQISTN